MNKITSWFSTRLALALVMVLSMSYASAKNVLTIDPVTISTSAGVTVPVNLNSVDSIKSLVFDITLPDGVTVDGEPVIAASRLDLDEDQTPDDLYLVDVYNNPDNLGKNVWRIGLFGLKSYSRINPGKGEVVSVKLAITEKAFFAGGKFTEQITTDKTPSVEGGEFTITIDAPKEAVAEVTVPAELNVNTGEKAKVEVSLNNNLPVAALMFNIELPESLKLAMKGRDYEFSYGPRWEKKNSVQVTENEKGVRVIISNMSSNVIAAAGEGELLSFYVIAGGESYKTKFAVTGINATMKWGGKNIDVFSADQTVSVINLSAMQAIIEQMDEDEAIVNEAATTYADFLAEAGENFPAFLTAKAEEIAAVYAKIEALNKSFEAAKVEAEETGVYAGLSTEEVTNLTDAILALVTMEAEELAKIENGKIEDLEALKAYADKVTPIVEGDVVYNEEIEVMAQNFLGELSKYSEGVERAEKTAKDETCEYVSPLTEEVRATLEEQYKALEALIDEIISGQIEEDQADINELTMTFAEFSEEASKEFPAFLEVKAEEVAAVYAKIEALNDSFVKAQEEAYETGVYNGISTEEITEVREALLGLISLEAEELAKIENGKMEDLEALNEYAQKVIPIVEEEVVYNDQIFTEAQNFLGELSKYAEEVEKAEKTAKDETCEYVSPLTEEVLANLAKQYEAIEEQVNEFIGGQIEEDQADINELTMTFAEFSEEVSKEFPAFLEVKAEEVAAVYAKIEALNESFVKAQEEAYETGVYNGISTEEITEVREALLGLISLEAEELAKIENGKMEDLEALNEYAQKVIPIVEEEVVYNDQIFTEAQNFLGELSKYAEEVEKAEKTAKDETCEYVSPLTEEVLANLAKQYDAIQDQINELIGGQIEEDQADINELATTFAAFSEEVSKEFPAFLEVNAEEVAEVYAKIEALNEAFVKAQEEAFETGVYNGISTEEITDVREALMGLITLEAEQLAKIENAAYDDLETLEKYANELNPVLDNEELSEDIYFFAGNIMGELYNYANEVYEAEYVAKQETGEYVSPLDEEKLEGVAKQLEELEEMLKTSAISSMVNDAQEAIYYDLNGFEVKEPVAGKLYIKVANGKATKVIKK